MSFIKRSFKKVACAVSGGVDSSVASYLLKQRGFEVIGVYMKNWDLADEKGSCTTEQDKEDAAFVCDKLGIPFIETNFVKEYWTDVFSELIKGYENGMTPNPDVLCNRHIKFGAFFQHLMENIGADAVATGHYAQNSAGNYLEDLSTCKNGVKLLMAKDKWKDQTIALSQIHQKTLQRTMFPVGSLFKKDVKKIALSLGLERIVRKQESTGICFVGKRNFHEFIEQYIEPKSGVFIDLENGKIVGEHKGTHYWTYGQRILIGGLNKAYFVAKVNAQTQEIFVASGTTHPALYTETHFTDSPHWINGMPCVLLKTDTLNCDFKYQHIHKRSACSIKFYSECGKIKGHVTNDRPMRSIAPGQYSIFYDGEECLGSAFIEKTGPTLYERGQTEELHELLDVPCEIKVS